MRWSFFVTGGTSRTGTGPHDAMNTPVHAVRHMGCHRHTQGASSPNGRVGALLSSPALGVRLPTALQVLQVLGIGEIKWGPFHFGGASNKCGDVKDYALLGAA